MKLSSSFFVLTLPIPPSPPLPSTPSPPGYFTSRPALKFYLRTMTNVLNAARQLALLAPNTTTCTSTSYSQTVCTDNLEAALAVGTHHDALSGTEKQAVADDYEQRLATGEAETRGMMAEALQRLTGLPEVRFCDGERGLNISFCPLTVARSTAPSGFRAVVYNPLGHAARHLMRVPVAAPAVTVVREADGSAVDVQVQPLAERARDLSRLYLQFYELNDTARVAAFTNNATHEAVFTVDLPAAGYETYLVTPTAAPPATAAGRAGRAAQPQPQPQPQRPVQPQRQREAAGTAVIRNEYYEATFAGGTLSTLRNLATGVEANVSLDLGFYISSDGGCTPDLPDDAADVAAQTAARAAKVAQPPPLKQKRSRRELYEDGMDLPQAKNKSEFPCDLQTSGAYIFRPKGPTVWSAACSYGESACWTTPELHTLRGNVSEEAHIAFADWATVVVRLSKGLPRLEVEYTVGPIPQNNPFGKVLTRLGKEVVLRYNSSLASEGRFYADSNGREMVERLYNRRGPAYPDPYPVSEPVAGNYYPVNMLLALEDRKANKSLAVAVDRSVGGASLHSGSLEFMVHRRTERTDGRGVGEALNETMCGCRISVGLCWGRSGGFKVGSLNPVKKLV